MHNLDRMFDDLALAWASTDSDGPERVLAHFADDCVFEDVTLGATAHGKEEFRSLLEGAFEAVPDIEYEVTNRLITARGAAIEWVM